MIKISLGTDYVPGNRFIRILPGNVWWYFGPQHAVVTAYPFKKKRDFKNHIEIGFSDPEDSAWKQYQAIEEQIVAHMAGFVKEETAAWDKRYEKSRGIMYTHY